MKNEDIVMMRYRKELTFIVSMKNKKSPHLWGATLCLLYYIIKHLISINKLFTSELISLKNPSSFSCYQAF